MELGPTESPYQRKLPRPSKLEMSRTLGVPCVLVFLSYSAVRTLRLPGTVFVKRINDYVDNVLENCIFANYIMLLTNVSPINLIKNN